MAEKSECKRLLVAAMDFGTAYSGYAFSFANEPMKVQTNQNWVAGSRSLISLKTPTCLLLTPQKQFHSFGYAAENKYTDLAMDEKHEDWYFFKQFKMLLHNTEGLKEGSMIEDVLGRKMPAMSIFSLSIKYLKDHLMDTLQNRVHGIVQEDVHFVITVPAIWDDMAKQFMRDAAVKAGISNDQLSIVLEPEAAAIWCQRQDSMKTSKPTSSSMENLFRTGLRYMVVDLGGGTVDIAVHEIKQDGSLGELYKATGGPWGGTCVDRGFIGFISKLVGQEVVREFSKKAMSDYIDLLREFETKKRSIKSDMDGKITFTVPISIKEIFEEHNGEVKHAASQSDFEGKVMWNKDKLRLEPSLAVRFFNESISGTINHLRKLLSDPSMQDIDTLLLVGGFAECELVQEAFKTNFKGKKIFIPEEAALVVLKGAVVLGHSPRAITTRISRFTYGARITPPFDPAIHPKTKRIVLLGKDCCNDVFDTFVAIGDKLDIGHTVNKETKPIAENQTDFSFGLYTSTERAPKFVTDPSCRCLGYFNAPAPDGQTKDDKTVVRTMIFGDTEIMFKVKHPKTGQEFKTFFQYE